MRAAIIVSLTACMCMSVMARYAIYPIMITGAELELREGRGLVIDNGARTVTNAYAKTAIRVKGILIDDEEVGQQKFVLLGKGEFEELDAVLDTDFDHLNFQSESESFNPKTGNGSARFVLKGVASDRVIITAPGLEVEALVLSSISLSAVLKMVNFVPAGETYSFRLNGSGAAIIALDGEPDAYAKVKMTLNSKLGLAMDEAYENAGGVSNETVSVQAAEQVLNAYINKAAKVNNANIELPEL